MKSKAYVIHLERATARRPQAVLLAQAMPMETEILSAVDGRRLSDAERRNFVRRKIHSPRYPFRLIDNEVGCFLSHRRAWQAIVDDGCDAGLVVEDDVAIASHEFPAVLDAALKAIAPNEVIRFPVHDRVEGDNVTRALGGVRFLEPRLPGLGMQMQLVGREAALRLLAASERFDRPVDSVVQMQWVHGARVLSVRPIVIREIDAMLGGTSLQNKQMGIVEKAIHEFQRPLLRLAVHSANERWRRRAA